MKKLLILQMVIVGIMVMVTDTKAQASQDVVIAVHGGAGTILREHVTPDVEQAYRDALAEALRAGHAILQQGGSSLNAVEAAIRLMEDSPLFNAGRGAVLTSEGTVELDASIMDGRDHSAGAVAGVKQVENPISLARLVMEESPHVLLAGEGAERFAQEKGVPRVPNDFFLTPGRRVQLERLQEQERSGGPTGAVLSPGVEDKYGTVGAVALDRAGNLAAGTSTGGMMNKRFGRVGDSPIIGAGTYADNATAAVSSTGHGEFFIRGVIAYEVAALMRLGGMTLQEAADAAIDGRLAEMGGTGGLIALDRQGNIAMPFNTAGMYRGYINGAGEMVIEIFRD